MASERERLWHGDAKLPSSLDSAPHGFNTIAHLASVRNADGIVERLLRQATDRDG